MPAEEEKSEAPKELNYKNNATPIHPLIAQLYRCELEDGEESKEIEDEKEPKKEKSPPQPIYRADEHDRQVELSLYWRP